MAPQDIDRDRSSESLTRQHTFSGTTNDIAPDSFGESTALFPSRNFSETSKQCRSHPHNLGMHGHKLSQHSGIADKQNEHQNPFFLEKSTISSQEVELSILAESTLSQAISSKKKITRQRRISSCVACRDKKVRCDKNKPSCSNCVKYEIKCSYIDRAVQVLNGPLKIPVMKASVGDKTKQSSSLTSLKSVVNLAVNEKDPVGSRALNASLYKTTIDNQSSAPTPTSPSISGASGFILCQSTASDLDFNTQSDLNSHSTLFKSSGRLINIDSHIKYSQTRPLSIASIFASTSAQPINDKYIPFYFKSFQDMYSHGPDILTGLPAISDMKILVEAYFETFHKFFGLVEPSQFREDVEQFYKDPSKFGWSKLALIISVLFTGIQFCALEKLSSSLSYHREKILTNLRMSIEVCLSRAEFLLNFDIDCLLSWLLLIFYFHSHGVSRNCTLLQLPTLLRLSQGIGLHRDPSHFSNCSFLEREHRRKVWSYLSFIDVYCSLTIGVEPLFSCDSFDTKLPLLLNDDELVKGSGYGGKYNQGHELIHGLYFPIIDNCYRFTDTTLLFIITASSHIFRRLFLRVFSLPQSRSFEEDLASVLSVKKVYQKIFDGIDHDIPIQHMTFCIGKIIIGRMMVYLYLPYIKDNENCLSSEAREQVILSSLYCLEYVLLVLNSPFHDLLSWLTRRFSQIEHMFFVLTKLEFDPSWRLKERAWNAVITNYEYFKQDRFRQSIHGWKIAEVLIDRVATVLSKVDDPRYQTIKRLSRNQDHQETFQTQKNKLNVSQSDAQPLGQPPFHYSASSTHTSVPTKRDFLAANTLDTSDKPSCDSSILLNDSAVANTQSLYNTLSPFSFRSSSSDSSPPRLANSIPTDALNTAVPIKTVSIPFSILTNAHQPSKKLQNLEEFSIDLMNYRDDSGYTNRGGHNSYANVLNQQDFATHSVLKPLSEGVGSLESDFNVPSATEKRALSDSWLGHDRGGNDNSSNSKVDSSFVAFNDNEPVYVDWSEWDKMVHFFQYNFVDDS
ncbi:hypothetical protein NADFUDRAFT_41258 [Nadsonia fulvescens var. elongata DSM 6958]|uniref:Zn(2)-C6 fungal-type domain-containing protein n=1 Tax=Nadsonia fulvescens var. elongata DSM 6958 TaxID=857566 RepID=A0A1E3PMS4_9ASCO|nr:hypothetical protein NADFUDRAFT_41258 [Nadsonia fulvescens var. elongata DSM 6958]